MATNLATAVDARAFEGIETREKLQFFATCPSSFATPDNYLHRVKQAAEWSEAAGCAGILVYTDNTLVDPWLVSQVLIENTHSLSPLVAVQPIYMHPYSVAKMVASLGFLYHRRVFLNMVAGGFKNDLAALNDPTPHDRRYDRLIEYTEIIQRLAEGRGPVTYDGEFYQVKNLTLSPALSKDLLPGVLMSGSSEAGLQAARRTGAIAVQYPEPPGKQDSAPSDNGPRGMRIGVIARPREEQAWDVALERFPEDRKGQLTRQLATKVSDSSWHHRLSELGDQPDATRDTYWLHPFNSYQTNCPYLVGSYRSVAQELERYIGLGYRSFILDIPFSPEEFEHTGIVFHDAAIGAGL